MTYFPTHSVHMHRMWPSHAQDVAITCTGCGHHMQINLRYVREPVSAISRQLKNVHFWSSLDGLKPFLVNSSNFITQTCQSNIATTHACWSRFKKVLKGHTKVSLGHTKVPNLPLKVPLSTSKRHPPPPPPAVDSGCRHGKM